MTINLGVKAEDRLLIYFNGDGARRDAAASSTARGTRAHGFLYALDEILEGTRRLSNEGLREFDELVSLR
ncbi:hypothetical protein [Bradyrhizobium sp. CB3481]|uniref:hypothetical protein n=1 Tax=Bradyrhizobium sp. CB3481 TaxID=3039158 RepID=UPI0024B1BCA3|nr:hypothetical protein [Bradyrhizobium sp. CB3481]WFU14999.1 hypothetical protein QA643_29040 [Bradyrhizobium sp. CB3481]